MNARDALRQAVQLTVANGLLGYERLRTGVTYNPLDRHLYSDPYPIYRRLRERDPVHRSWLMKGWVFTRHQDVLSVLHDARFSADERNAPNFAKALERARKKGLLSEDEEFSPSMLRSDPPHHTRLRKLVSKAFTPRAIQDLEGKIQSLVQDRLDQVAPRGRMDVVHDLGIPLPVIVIAELIGVPREDQDRFRHWSDEVVRSIGFSTIADERASQKAGRELRAYFQDIAEQRRREPRDDLMSGLLAAEEEGDRLSSEEVFSTLELLLIAGNETTTNLIGNGILALLRNPDQYERLHRDPSLIDSALEELLRYDGPVQATSRIAKEDLEIGGVTVRRGQNALIVLGAANRDPSVFDEPEGLDLGRQQSAHLAFGHGVHFCLGSHLARLEARHAIGALVHRFASMKLAIDTPRWKRNLILRGLESLPVRF
jgi:pimeloyl-[acyl-carrier protein] synthase